MALPRNIPEVRLERATSPKRRHQYDHKTSHSRPMQKTTTVTRKIQTHNLTAGTMEIIYRRRTISPARKSRKMIRPGALSPNATKYTIKKTTTTTRETATPTSTTLETELLAITAKLAKNRPNVKPFPFQPRNIVNITQPDGTERLAMISETTSFHDSQIAVVCVWLYTRAEIADDMVRNSHGGVSLDEAQKYLHSKWPINVTESARSQCNYMLSTERTVVVSDGTNDDDTCLKLAPPHVAERLCWDAVYDTYCSSSSAEEEEAGRRICDVNDVECRWLKKIL